MKLKNISDVRWLKLSGKVLEDDASFKDECKISGDHYSVTPAVPGSILMKCDPKNNLTSERQTKYCSGIGAFLHLM